mmetsp:Transcript_68104/g.221744  ORF Transcript_68104/g.221744 Transcript_68104/m.221744 type:complete len:414 (-) Transcript_68104:117-1358(-)
MDGFGTGGTAPEHTCPHPLGSGVSRVVQWQRPKMGYGRGRHRRHGPRAHVPPSPRERREPSGAMAAAEDGLWTGSPQEAGATWGHRHVSTLNSLRELVLQEIEARIYQQTTEQDEALRQLELRLRGSSQPLQAQAAALEERLQTLEIQLESRLSEVGRALEGRMRHRLEEVDRESRDMAIQMEQLKVEVTRRPKWPGESRFEELVLNLESYKERLTRLEHGVETSMARCVDQARVAVDKANARVEVFGNSASDWQLQIDELSTRFESRVGDLEAALQENERRLFQEEGMRRALEGLLRPVHDVLEATGSASPPPSPARQLGLDSPSQLGGGWLERGSGGGYGESGAGGGYGDMRCGGGGGDRFGLESPAGGTHGSLRSPRLGGRAATPERATVSGLVLEGADISVTKSWWGTS